jgi:hypothetical protein
MKSTIQFTTFQYPGKWSNSCRLVITLFCILLLIACKKDDPEPETDRVRALLKANTWRIQQVTVDGTDQAALFTGLTLSFTETNYTTTNGGLVWPASGSWAFKDDTAKKIVSSDGLEITVLELSATSLKLTLTWDAGTLGLGRISSVAGDHTFNFVKN